MAESSGKLDARQRAIEGLLSEVHTLTFHDDRLQFFPALFKHYVLRSEDREVLGPHLISFYDNLSRYSPEDRALQLKSLVIATVAHEFNAIEKNRYRKEQDEQGRRLPYILHNLRMYKRLHAEGKYSRFKVALPMTILLHDVVEDCVMHFPSNEGFSIEKSEWVGLFEREFTTNRYPLLGRDVVKFVQAVSEGERVIDSLLDSDLPRISLFKVIENSVTTGRATVNKLEDDSYDANLTVKVINSLVRALSVAYQDPTHWPILGVKLLDIWENSGTPKWVKQEKIIRAIIGASMAEMIGWESLGAEILRNISGVCNLESPNALFNKIGVFYHLNDTTRSDIVSNWKRHALLRGASYEGTGYVRNTNDLAGIFRFGHTIEAEEVPAVYSVTTPIDRSLPSLQFVSTDPNLLSALQQSIYFTLNGHRHNRLVTHMEQLRMWLGRECVSFLVRHGGAYLAAVKLRDAQPTVFDTFSQDFAQSGHSFNEVPERSFFTFDSSANTAFIQRQILHQLAFTYNPSSLVLIGEDCHLVFYKTRQTAGIAFAESRRRLQDVLADLDLSEDQYAAYYKGKKIDRTHMTLRGISDPRNIISRRMVFIAPQRDNSAKHFSTPWYEVEDKYRGNSLVPGTPQIREIR